MPTTQPPDRLPDRFPLDGVMREALLHELWGRGVGGLRRPEDHEPVICAVMRRILNILAAQAVLEGVDPTEVEDWCGRAFQRKDSLLPPPTASSDLDDWNRWIYWAWEVQATAGLGEQALIPLIRRHYPDVVWLVAGCAWIQESSGSNLWKHLADSLKPLVSSTSSMPTALTVLASSHDVIVGTCTLAIMKALVGEKRPWEIKPRR